MSDLPPGWRLDPNVEQIPGVHYVWAITDTGARVAWQGGPIVICPVCHNDSEKRIDCQHCSGRGMVDTIPYADRPWDEVALDLWLGGVQCQPAGAPNGDAFPKREFDVVVSLVHAPGYEPTGSTEHHEYGIADAELDPEHHEYLEYLARRIDEDNQAGKKVLVRCMAGLNRSAMVMALVLHRKGWSMDDAIARMRDVRSPYVLFNQSFVDFLKAVEAREAAEVDR